MTSWLMLHTLASAAKRRRERRLRAMLRHERRSVAMALARVHAPLLTRTEDGQGVGGGGERGARTAYGHRRLHLRVSGPGCLPDPGPQRSDRTVRHSAGEAPSLLPPSAGRCGGRCCGPLLVGLPPQSVAPPEEEERRRRRRGKWRWSKFWR